MRIVFCLIMWVFSGWLVGCSRHESAEKGAELMEKQEECRLRPQDRYAQTVNGKWLDLNKMSRTMSTYIRPELDGSGKCVVSWFQTYVYWTGGKIVPDDSRFHGYHEGGVPTHWNAIQVSVGLSNPGVCQRQPDVCKYGRPRLKDVPERRRMKLNKYKDIEQVFGDEELEKGHIVAGMSFIVTNWKGPEGDVRFIDCSLPRELREESEPLDVFKNVDFGKRTIPCQMHGLEFNDGVARIDMGTDLLHDIVPAMKALQVYLNNLVIEGK